MTLDHYSMTLDQLRIIKSSFSLNHEFKKSMPVTLTPEIAIAHKFDKTKFRLSILLKVSLLTGDVPFFFEVEGEGNFTFSEMPSDNILEQFSTMNCPAIIFPYIRETVADLTRRASLPPFHLPILNFVEIAKENKEKVAIE